MFGVLADARGPAAVLWVIAVLPVLAFLLALTLPTLAKDRREGLRWSRGRAGT